MLPWLQSLSDFCPFPADQLCGVARIVTGISKVTLLRQQSHCWVFLPAFLGIFLPSSCPGLFSVLAWPAGIMRDPLAHVQRAGDLCVPLARWFLVDIASKTPSQFLVPITIAVLYFSSWSISVLQTNIMEMVEYSHTGLAECSVTCPLCVLRGVKAERSQHLMSSEFIWTVSLCEGNQN